MTLKKMTGAGCLAVLLLLAWSPRLFSASFDFKASENYVIKNEDTVVFTLTYDPEGTPSDVLKLELDYDGDNEIDWTLDNLDGGESTERTHNVTYGQAGYFDAEAYFTLTEDDGTFIDRESLGPIRINVANWIFTDNESLGCIESTPAAAPNGATIYAGSEDGKLYAINASDGTRKWRFFANGPINSSPAVDNEGNIYFGSADGFVYCLASDGNLIWQYQTGDAVYSSPALDNPNRNLYIGSTDNYLYALDMDNGSRLWRYKTGAKVTSSPVIGYDHTIYLGSQDQFLYALYPNGSLKWRFNAGAEIFGSPALDKDGSIFVGTAKFRGEVSEANGLYAISPSGQKKWFVQKINGFPAAPVIGKAGTVVVGSWDNRLYGINRNGKGGLKRFKTFSDDLVASPALGTSDYLYAGSKDKRFIALDLERVLGGDREEQWEYSLSYPLTTSSPVIKNGFVYFGTCGYENGALISLFGSEAQNQTPIEASTESPWPLFRNTPANTGKTGLTAETIAPAVITTDPAPGATNLDTGRNSITATFSMPMNPDSIYQPPDPANDFDGYFGFMLEPFDEPDEDFDVTSNADNTRFTLTLPEGASFEPDTDYTATILSRAHAEGDAERTILYTYEWSFSQEKPVSNDNSHDSWSCFLGTLLD